MKNEMKDEHQYDDIINLPHHVSQSHPQMSIQDRAAQFSPFAALTGYDGAIKETARLTNERMELDEAARCGLDESLSVVLEQLRNQPEIEITYFQPDVKKSGGAYVSVKGIVKKIDRYKKSIIMQDETKIPIEEIISITGRIFQSLDEI